jgi:CheY-like chemotaxis protein
MGMLARRDNNVRILLVEDSKPIRRENERALLEAGYEVVCAVDGESALRFARDMKPDLILLDMISAQVGADRKCSGSRPKPRAEIPVLAVSSLSQKDRQKLMEEGLRITGKNSELMPTQGVSLLSQAVPICWRMSFCRINRKPGVGVSSIPPP